MQMKLWTRLITLGLDQDTKDWNQQPPRGFPPQLKPRLAGLTAKRGRVKIQPAGPTSVPPSCSSTSVVETNPESSAVSQLVRQGRGWGSRLGGRKKSPHGRRRQFHCSYCDYASVRRYNTERHIRLRHPTYRYKVGVLILRSEFWRSVFQFPDLCSKIDFCLFCLKYRLINMHRMFVVFKLNPSQGNFLWLICSLIWLDKSLEQQMSLIIMGHL